MRNCLRQIDFSSVILQFAWGFLLSTVKSLICLRQLDADWVIILSAWGFFSYYVLKRYISWSDESSTTWFFCLPKAFFISRIEGVHVLRLWSLNDLISPSAWGFFSYHVLKGYMFWSDGVSTTWFFRLPKALLCITYWSDTYPKGNGR